MGKHLKITFLLLLIGSLFNQCNTYIWQPVEKQLVGTWRMSPQNYDYPPDAPPVLVSYEEWTFTDGGLLYRVNVALTNPPVLDTIRTCRPDVSVAHTFEVENKITKHFILTPNILFWCDGEDNPKWLVVKINKSEMYLTTVDDNNTKGSFQFGFIKVD